MLSRIMTKIGTHNGAFHCDEAMAIAILSFVKKFNDYEVVRTRDPAVLETCDVVVDVGGVYDPAQLRFDHHQRGFMETFSETHKTKLSSSGLVFKHFGREAIISAANLSSEEAEQLSPADLDTVCSKMYDRFLEELDGVDNGIDCVPKGVECAYHRGSSLPSRVGLLNPRWNNSASGESSDEKFKSAVDLCRTEFMLRADKYINGWLPARSIVRRSFDDRRNVSITGKIVKMETFCPWKEHLLTVDSNEEVMFVIYEDSTGSSFRVQAVPKGEESFESRMLLPEEWRGIRDDDLSKLSGIDGCVFVHAAGFIGGNKTYEGAVAMAKKAVGEE